LKLLSLLLPLILLVGCAQTALVSRDALTRTDKYDLQSRVNIRMELASAYYAEGQYATALQEIDRVIAINPAQANAHGLRGLSLMQLGDDGQAEISLRTSLNLDADNPELNNNMGWFLCQRQSPSKAMPYFIRALSINAYTSPAKALLNAGLCSKRGGDVASAESYLLRALKAEPGLTLAHVTLANIYYDRADYKSARQHILSVVETEQIAADNLLMAIRIERKLGDRVAEHSLAAKLRRLYPDSPQTATYFSGETDER
jgi:type IV pilus assembly protein PilF